MRIGYVYILASQTRGTIYIGVTSNLSARLYDHQSKKNPDSFTARYNCDRLVWFEEHTLIVDAIAREKSLKTYPRQWKINLIEAGNPNWEPLLPY